MEMKCKILPFLELTLSISLGFGVKYIVGSNSINKFKPNVQDHYQTPSMLATNTQQIYHARFGLFNIARSFLAEETISYNEQSNIESNQSKIPSIHR
jgi:hypothetical protein